MPGNNPKASQSESARLAELDALMILDTAPEERFDRVVRFAARELGVPIALVSLVAEDRQWFKAKVGLTVSETPRDSSFCSRAIASDEIFVIEDAKSDARFRDNPLVTGDPNIRFYAGAPISGPSGNRLGSICVIDTRPRTPGRMELMILDAVRQVVNDMLAGREPEPLPAMLARVRGNE